MRLERPTSEAWDDPAVAGVPELTVVIPTFCERDNVSLIIARLATALNGVAWEVIFVDDNSPDGTAALIKSIGAKDPRIRCIRRVKRRGLAGACIEGMLASQATYVAVIDADLQHDESLLPRMLEHFGGGAVDIVIGTRYGGGSAEGLSPTRLWGSRFATRLVTRFLGLRVSDPLSGFFMVKRSIIEEVAPRLSVQGFKILLDILASAGPSLRVHELAYTFRARQHGESKLDLKVLLDLAGLTLAKVTADVIPVQFFSFLFVGSIGIVIHLIALKILLSATSIGFIWAQAGATAIAIVSNFLLNNELTFRDQRLTGMRAVIGLLIFFAISAFGAGSNIGVANWLFSNGPSWWFAGVLGAIVSAVWNYAVSSVLVWPALSRLRH